MILFIFFAMLRTKSQMLMRHWAQVEPFGYFGKGVQQPGNKSFGGMFSSTLRVSLNCQDKIYDEHMPAFYEKLLEELYATGAFDNYQKVNIKKEAIQGKKYNHPQRYSISSKKGSAIHVTTRN